MPKISVVITVFNKERSISATLSSVLSQNFKDIEVIIIDDGSTDGSKEKIKGFETKNIYYYYQPNGGASAARNAGIKKATSTNIAFLDGDDIWAPNHLENLNTLLLQFPEEKVFATGVTINKNGKKSPATYSTEKETIKAVNYFKSSLKTSILLSSNMLIKKEVFEKVGYYNTNYASGEDTDFYIRLGLQYAVVFNPEITVTYVMGDDGLHLSSTSINGKPTFKDYETEEAKNKDLKSFLDINRFSLALIAKLEGNTRAFKNIVAKINFLNLNRRQRFLLKQSKTTLNFLFKTKKSLERLGWKLSAFK